MCRNCGARSEARPEPPQELEFMFGSEPIIAYRCWDVDRHADMVHDWGTLIEALAHAHDLHPDNPYREMLKPRLGAVGYGSIPWPPRAPMVAKCSNGCQPPGRDHECGIWAVRDEDALNEVLAGYGGPGKAFGRVQLWGRYREFERGYRAQYAYPMDVTIIDGDPALAEQLAQDYGIPATVGSVPEGVVMRGRSVRSVHPLNAPGRVSVHLAATAMMFASPTYVGFVGSSV